MNEVWLTLPSANILMAKKTFPLWKNLGYKIAVVCPDKDKGFYTENTHLLFTESEIGGYSGWPKSVNYLSKQLKDVDIIIAAGDDMFPDPNFSAEELRKQFIDHFLGTYGVMQPNADKFGSNACSTCEQICGSAWIGKDFRNTVNGGRGPLWEEYWHMYADTELYQVALKHNCLWVREDLTQYHEHRLRKTHNFIPSIPSGNTKISKDIYDRRKANLFPHT